MTEPVGWVVCELVLLGGDNCQPECEQVNYPPPLLLVNTGFLQTHILV